MPVIYGKPLQNYRIYIILLLMYFKHYTTQVIDITYIRIIHNYGLQHT